MLNIFLLFGLLLSMVGHSYTMSTESNEGKGEAKNVETASSAPKSIFGHLVVAIDASDLEVFSKQLKVMHKFQIPQLTAARLISYYKTSSGMYPYHAPHTLLQMASIRYCSIIADKSSALRENAKKIVLMLLDYPFNRQQKFEIATSENTIIEITLADLFALYDPDLQKLVLKK